MLLCYDDAAGCDCLSLVAHDHRSETLHLVRVFLILVLPHLVLLKSYFGELVNVLEISELLVAVRFLREDLHLEVLILESV